MNVNLAKAVLQSGGSISPLMVPFEMGKGTGQMNPSLFADNGKLLCNLRGVQYVICHSENKQHFPSHWGPLAYINPENDIHLRTTNFYMEIDPVDSSTLIRRISQVDTSKLDIEPVWEFIGLEDARLVKWYGNFYLCGVRRDTKPNGEGRIELSEIEIRRDVVKEVARWRIEPPIAGSYCEKNWMPVLDMPFHFVKWSNPTEVVKVHLETLSSETVFLSHGQLPGYRDFRGGSSVISFQGFHIAVIHEVDLYKNEAGNKDADYYHRFIAWDQDWNIVALSDNFNFMGAKIEFCCGLAYIAGSFYISFGFQDNAAYLLVAPHEFITDFLFNQNQIR